MLISADFDGFLNEILIFSTKIQRILMKIELSALTSACFMGVLILKLAENLKNKVLGQKTPNF